MTNYLPYIFGIPALFGGLYLFLLYFGIYKPKYKRIEDKERFEESLKKYGTLIKICSIIMILNGGYDLIVRDENRYKLSSSKSEEWTVEIKEIMNSKCMQNAGNTAKNYPEITRKYCECTTEQIVNSLTYNEYLKIIQKPIDEQKKLLMPLIQDCVNQLKTEIDSIETQKSSR